MRKMLYRRYPRELKENIGIYVAIFLIIAMGLGTVLGGDDSMIEAVGTFFESAELSDGYVDFVYPLEAETIEKAEEKNIFIEEQFYYDIEINGKELRVFRKREKQNQEYVSDGSLPESNNEIFLEKHFAEAGEYEVGDKITIGDEAFNVIGIGCFPDYIYVLKKSSDINSHTESFSVVSVTEEAFEKIKKTTESLDSVVYHYSFTLGENTTISDAEEFFAGQEIPMLELVDSSKDPRVITHKEDCAMVKRATFIDIILAYLFWFRF